MGIRKINEYGCLDDGEMDHYKCLNVLEFDSTRKMMSIIVQNEKTKVIEVLTKGADSFVEEKLREGEQSHPDLI